MGKAPMRENLAYLMLRQAGYTGTETVVDPMCGSGTFGSEAAEIAMGLNPGRSRHFAFEDLASFDAAQWAAMRDTPTTSTPLRFYGSDRDAGAVRMSRMNAERAGVADAVTFDNHAAGELSPPHGPPDPRPGPEFIILSHIQSVQPHFGESLALLDSVLGHFTTIQEHSTSIQKH